MSGRYEGICTSSSPIGDSRLVVALVLRGYDLDWGLCVMAFRISMTLRI